MMIKPTVLIVFVLGIAGYNILRNFHKTHYMLKRSSGYHTFFSSSTAGILLFVLASLLYFWLVKLGYSYNSSSALGRDFLESVFFTSFSEHLEIVSIFEISILTLILSQLLPFILYLPLDKKELLRKEFFQDPESPEFTRLFYRSSLSGVPVLFTLSDRKVYIGYIYEIPVTQFTDIYILPIYSGFRCKDKLTLNKVTPYKPVVDYLEQKEKTRLEPIYKKKGIPEEDLDECINERLDQRNFWADFMIAVPLREIVHAHLHDFAHEQMFKDHEVNEQWRKLGSFTTSSELYSDFSGS